MLLLMDNRPLAVNCDWLTLSLKFDPCASVEVPNGFRDEELPGTNVFKKRHMIYSSEGRKVATFCYDPYSSVIPQDIATCQIANPYLYNPDVNLMMDIVRCFKHGVFNGISRWDIACDFCPTPAEMKTIRKLGEGSQYVSNKTQGSVFWHTEKYNSIDYRMPHCLSWGSPSSTLHTKLYNKSLEINAANAALCTKPYILDEWSYHLPDTSMVWRLEFSLTDVNQVAFDDRRISIEDAFSSQVLCDTFSTIKRGRFIVRMNQGRRHGHKNEDTVVPFLPFDTGLMKIRKANAVSERSPLEEERALARHIWLHLTDRTVLADDDRFVSLRNCLLGLCEIPTVCSYVEYLANMPISTYMEQIEEMRFS